MIVKEPSFRMLMRTCQGHFDVELQDGYFQNDADRQRVISSAAIYRYVLEQYDAAIKQFIEVTNLDHEDQRALKEIMGVPE